VLSKLDYCNSVYYALPKSRITCLLQIQSLVARVVVKTISCQTTLVLHCLHWLKITNSCHLLRRLRTKSSQRDTTTQLSYLLHNFFSLQPPCNTRFSSLLTFARSLTSSLLRLTDCSFPPMLHLVSGINFLLHLVSLIPVSLSLPHLCLRRLCVLVITLNIHNSLTFSLSA